MATILVIEDNPQNLKLAELVLHKAGHAVLSAGSGEAGLELAGERLPDLILMDVQMPGLDGLAVTRLLKNSPRTANIKVIALTALAMKGDAERMLAAGFDAYIAKPFHYKDLLQSVQRLLG
jgi:two-component system cell cycle response regulator DivK